MTTKSKGWMNLSKEDIDIILPKRTISKKRKHKTFEEKRLWNEAIRAAAKEILKWDGVIPDERDRETVANGIVGNLSYKGKF